MFTPTRARRLHRRLKEDPASAELGYAEAETLRDEEYYQSVQDRSQQFEEDRQKHAEDEHQRRSEFTSLVTNCRITFEADREHRESQYKAAAARWEAVFRVNDATRNAVFKKAEQNRAFLHQQDQDARDKAVKTYEAMRDQRFKDGRRARIALCADLEKALEGQVQDLLLAQETSFILNKTRRDAIMAALEDTEPDNARHILYSQPVHFRPRLFPTFRHEQKMDETLAELIDSQSPGLSANINTSGNPSGSTVVYTPWSKGRGDNKPHGDHTVPMAPLDDIFGSRNSGFASTNPYETVVQANPRLDVAPTSVSLIADRTPTVVPVGDFSDHAASPTTPFSSDEHDPSASYDKGSGNLTPKVSNQQDNFEESFRTAQTRRQTEYLNEDRDRKELHAAEELAREEMEQGRTTAFTERMFMWNLSHTLAASSFDSLFEQSETNRNGAENHREILSRVQHDIRLQYFEAVLRPIRQSFVMKDKAETEVTREMHATLTRLYRKQMLLLQEARRERFARFFTTQQLMLAAITKPSMDDTPQEHGMVWRNVGDGRWLPPASGSKWRGVDRWRLDVTGSLDERESLERRGVANGWPGWDAIRSGAGWSGNRNARKGSLSPPTGFAARLLFKAENLQDSLPIPRDHKDPYERRRQNVFHQSQAQRKADFEHGAEVRRQSYVVIEAKQQLCFKNMQRERQELFNDNKDRWDREFREAQADRERRSSAAEELRVVNFHDAQQSREVQFRRSQEGFDQLFHSTQEHLWKKCREGEEKRSRDLGVWATELMESREREGSKLFEIEENEREELFQQVLKIFGIQRGSA
ncbi:hypothetical protein DXG01_012089 [Tephrocybe rancida]|nr:hypothetical protein DXG01_012089 [Tephrocybe rancida]